MLISIVLGLMMFALGTSLTLSDFKQIARQKKAVGLGLLLQMLFLPILAFIIVLVAPIEDAYKVGIFLVAICPGGATSNFISYLLKADTALSVSLTMINSFLIVFTIPVLALFALDYFMDDHFTCSLSMEQTIKDMFLMIMLPVGVGLVLRYKWSDRIINLEKPLKIVSSLLLALVFLLKFLGDKSDEGIGIEVILELLPYVLLLHIVGMGFSYIFSKKLLNNKRSAVTIGIEVGLQNTALALWITEHFSDSNLMGHPALVYALFSFFTTLGFGFLVVNLNS